MAKIGLDGILYRGTAGSSAATQMTNVKDLSFPDERSVADISTRGSTIELGRTTMRKLSISWSMNVDDADADYAAIQTAYLANTPLAFKCISATTDSGIDADWNISKFNQQQPLRDGQTVEVEITPTYVSRYPAAVSGT